MKEKAFNGKILNVFLNRGAAEKEELPEQMCRDYLGGYGLGARLLFDRVPAGADALGPDNILGLMPGLTLDIETLEREFLQACDWDVETGKPSREKLVSLGLEDVARQINA